MRSLGGDRRDGIEQLDPDRVALAEKLAAITSGTSNLEPKMMKRKGVKRTTWMEPKMMKMKRCS